MQLLNCAYITDALIAIQKPLARFVAQSIQNSRMYKNSKDPDAWWKEGVIRKLNSEGRKEYMLFVDDDVRIESMDVSASVALLETYSNTIFLELFGPDACLVRSWAQEIRALRNSVSHQKKRDLTYKETKHGLEAMKMLLEKIYEVSGKKGEEIRRVQALLDDLEARKKEREAMRKKKNAQAETPFGLKKLPPMFDFSTPRKRLESMIKIGLILGWLVLAFDYLLLEMQMKPDLGNGNLYDTCSDALSLVLVVMFGVPLNAFFGIMEVPEWEGQYTTLVGTITQRLNTEYGFQLSYGWTGLIILGICVLSILFFGLIEGLYDKKDK